jgi:hypothetical protein
MLGFGSGFERALAARRKRKRYERALRAASAQLHRSRARELAEANWIGSLDIVQALRRANRRAASTRARSSRMPTRRLPAPRSPQPAT